MLLRPQFVTKLDQYNDSKNKNYNFFYFFEISQLSAYRLFVKLLFSHAVQIIHSISMA